MLGVTLSTDVGLMYKMCPYFSFPFCNYIYFLGILHYMEAIYKLVKRVEFVGDSLSCIVLRGHWSNTIILNVYAPSEEKSDDSKDSFYEELE